MFIFCSLTKTSENLNLQQSMGCGMFLSVIQGQMFLEVKTATINQAIACIVV